MTKNILTKTILLVDDRPENIQVLFEFLNANGFEVLIAEGGMDALDITQGVHPDLILLDIMMPDMDGFETCRRLKNNLHTADIPIIFMTALSDTESKIRGFELGAVDYVTKPFQQSEVLARINTHLTMLQLRRQLQRQNDELEAFSRMVAHDLKNPLSGVLSVANLLLMQNSNFTPQQTELLQVVEQSGKQMLEIIDALLLLAGVSKQNVTTVPLDMAQILFDIQPRLHQLMEQYQGVMDFPASWPRALGYPQWVAEIWANYLSNGLKYGGRPPLLQLGWDEVDDEMLRFWVKDNGKGLTLEQQEKLFIPFSRLNKDDHIEGHGLGLSIVQRITERLGGYVGVESEVESGCLFFFALPKV